jgi:hypothetical protein
MKLSPLFWSLAILGMALATSCQKEEDSSSQKQISKEALAKIHKLGFSTENAQLLDEGYLVEGDIILTDDDLNTTPDSKFIVVGEEEQYRTTNLVTGLPRNITIRVSSSLPSAYVSAINTVVSRYNALGLRITFSRVSSGGNIVINPAPSGSGYLASAGFPSSGRPFGQVRVNSSYLGSNPGNSYLATILAHEVGHCIGFRHTDYANRAYSCGGSSVNEGASSVGAIRIPGTPSGADPSSWMLACIGSGANRPFNSNDKTALNYLY